MYILLEIYHNIMNIKHLLILGIALVAFACKADKPAVEKGNLDGQVVVSFSEDSFNFGVIDSEEWFEIPISTKKALNSTKSFGVEVIASESSAVEDYHFVMESHTVTIAEGTRKATLRIKGLHEAIAPGQVLRLKLYIVNDGQEEVAESIITLQRCCAFDINNFSGYAILTSTWSLEYMNTQSRLVHTHPDKDESDVVVIEDMFYENYDIRVKLHTEDRLNPLAELCGPQVLGSTGEAFGTIYGNGKLMVDRPIEMEGLAAAGASYYSTCENFLFIYTGMYVEEVGVVGNFVNILEWISDEEAERIMREGF